MTDEVIQSPDMLIKHGQNTSDRMTESLLRAILDQLVAIRVNYNGRVCAIRPLGAGVTQDPEGNWRALFDIVEPGGGFDHVEFKLAKTGWGRGG